MKHLLFVLLFTCGVCHGFAQTSYRNPVLDDSSSQPDVTVFSSSEGNFYLFYTHILGKGVFYNSSNLTDWTKTNVSPYGKDVSQQIQQLAAQSPNIHRRDIFCLWAPQILKVGDKWNLYTSIENWGGIIVLQADSATGPYKFVGEPYTLVTPEDMDWPYDAIDPCVVRDADGTMYMFFGSAYGIYRAKLTDDGLHVAPDNQFIHVAGPTSPTQKVDGKLHGGMEGCFVYWHEGWWYLFCSKRIDYSIYVGRCRTLDGPFLDREGRDLADGYGTRMNYPCDGFHKPGHNAEIFEDKDGHYYIFYHATTVENVPDIYGHRQPCLSEMLWDRKGFPYIKDRKTRKDGNRTPRL